MTIRNVLISLFVAVASVAAVAADCANCGGGRVIGTGPIRLACPACAGAGTDTLVSIERPASLPEARTEPAAADYGRARPVVARVRTASGPSTCYGSGVLVAASGTHGIVLTNWHVVRTHRTSISVTFPDGSTSAGRVLASDDAWDLAALLVNKPQASPVLIAAAAPKLGDRLTIAGYGQGEYLEQSGAVTDYLSPTSSHERQFVELKASARQGDSGGPIFNERGELAGVLFGERDGRTIGPCSTRLRTFLSGVQWPSDQKPTSTAKCPNGRCATR